MECLNLNLLPVAFFKLLERPFPIAAMINNLAIFLTVGPDLVGTHTAPSLLSPLLIQSLEFVLLLMCLYPCAQHGPGIAQIRMLTTAIGACLDPGGLMGQHDLGVGRIAMLPAFPGSPRDTLGYLMLSDHRLSQSFRLRQEGDRQRR